VDGTESGVSGGLNEPHWRSGNSQADCSTLRGRVELILESMPRRVAAPPLDTLILLKIPGEFMDIRTLQRPLKEQYRQNPSSSRITLKARGSQTDAPITCSVDLGREIYKVME
jgi:hypothetical protein